MADGQVWDRMEGEPNRWHQWFERYRLLGPDRSLLAVFNQWRLAKSREVSRSVPKSWRTAAETWTWKQRAEAWDQYLSNKAAKEAEARRLEILSSGYAQRHERVRVLNELAGLLEGDLREETLRWLHDTKGIGSGDNFSEVEVIRFNSPLIEQFRRTLDDLAQELGERVRGLELSGSVQQSKVSILIPDNERNDRNP